MVTLELVPTISGYITPITKRTVRPGSPFTVSDAEANRLLETGKFFKHDTP